MGIRNYLWSSVDDCVVMEKDGIGQTTAVSTHEPAQFGGLISERRGDETRYYHYDALGSTRHLTNAAGQVTDSFLYDAFGNTIQHTGNTFVPYHFVGRSGYYYDWELAEYYVRARHYLPASGRWLSQDPVGYADAISLYPYVYGRVLRAVDVTGMLAEAATYAVFRDDREQHVGIGEPLDCTIKKDIEVCAAICQAAAQRADVREVRQGNTVLQGGGIICHEGTACACLFDFQATMYGGADNNDKDRIRYQPGRDPATDKCLLEHERAHFRDVVPCDPKRLYYRPEANPGLDLARRECDLRATQKDCLVKALSEGRVRAESWETAYRIALDFVRSQKRICPEHPGKATLRDLYEAGKKYREQSN